MTASALGVGVLMYQLSAFSWDPASYSHRNPLTVLQHRWVTSSDQGTNIKLQHQPSTSKAYLYPHPFTPYKP